MPCTMFEVLADVIEMENGENKTTIDVVVISDDKDSEHEHPLDIYLAEDWVLPNLQKILTSFGFQNKQFFSLYLVL